MEADAVFEEEEEEAVVSGETYGGFFEDQEEEEEPSDYRLEGGEVSGLYVPAD